MYQPQSEAILANVEEAHARYYASEVFGGPSLYFHERALAEAESGDFGGFAESSYAMLTAWGMHRMGRGGAKMNDFDPYRISLKKAWPEILRLRGTSPDSLGSDGWASLEEAFLRIKAMRTSFSLVANSKVLAHALPDLVPPVDRQYTIRFLHGWKQLPTAIEGEWTLLRSLLEGFFYPALRDQRFTDALRGWRTSPLDFPWDTSALKTVDNVLVGHVRGSQWNTSGAPPVPVSIAT